MNLNLKNFLVLIFATVSLSSVAQSNLLNAKTPSEIGKKTAAQLVSDNDKPLPYGFVDDRDVLMSKMVWETIDLDERINFPLYFPIDTLIIGADRRSLYDVLLNGIKSGKITEVYQDSYFTKRRTLDELKGAFKQIDTLPGGFDQYNENRDLYRGYTTAAQPAKKNKKGQIITPATEAKFVPAQKQIDPQFLDIKELSAGDIRSYRIKGVWYFDKRQGELKYRLLGICPQLPSAKFKDDENPDLIDMFWVYFPAARDVLHGSYAFNDRNTSMPMSFDRLLNSRRFNSVITKEENVNGDREIQAYMKDNSQMQLLEAERVKDKIRDFEQDMWNY